MVGLGEVLEAFERQNTNIKQHYLSKRRVQQKSLELKLYK